jgi:hypothetical protein
MGNPKKCFAAARHSFDDFFKKMPSDHQVIFGLKVLENT